MRLAVLVSLAIGVSALAAPLPNHVLARKVRESPRGSAAKEYVKELDRRGVPGWRTISGLIRDVARKDAGAARGLVKKLAAGPEPGRLEALRSAWRKNLPAVVRADLAVALARGYPEGAAMLIHALFDAELPRRGDLLRELAKHGLKNEELRKALTDPRLAPDAYSILTERGFQPSPKEMRELAKTTLESALSHASLAKFCAVLAKGRRWPLVEAIALLTGDKDVVLARSAHIFLLRISGKDMARDPDIWRSWIAVRRSKYRAPEDSSDGRVAAAVLLGAEMLRRDLLDDGRSEMKFRPNTPGQYPVGATALSVLALSAAGFRSTDPAIANALETTLLPKNEHGTRVIPKTARRRTYSCALLLMALAAVDAKTYKSRIQALASLLVASQLPSGQWTYQVGERYFARGAPTRRMRGDNSNTQYALLALRAARRAGADVPAATWMRALSFWHMALTDRGWGYALRRRGAYPSMTAAGLSSVAICMEGLHVSAGDRIANHKAIAKGLRALGRDLLSRGYRGVVLYAYYGIERACILTGTRRFNDFDWYRVGAGNLVRGQAVDGSWWGKTGQGKPARGRSYGPAIETAYALLFLKRATTRIDGGRDRGTVKIPEFPSRQRSRPPRMAD